MFCNGKNPVLKVMSNVVKETQLINLNLNLNKRYFTKSLIIVITYHQKWHIVYWLKT